MKSKKRIIFRNLLDRQFCSSTLKNNTEKEIKIKSKGIFQIVLKVWKNNILKVSIHFVTNYTMIVMTKIVMTH